MDDDFIEELEEQRESFTGDEVLDYTLIEEMKNKNRSKNGSGCLTSLFVIILYSFFSFVLIFESF